MTRGLELTGDAVEVLDLAARDHDIGAVLRQPMRRRGPDTGTAACDHGDPPGQIEDASLHGSQVERALHRRDNVGGLESVGKRVAWAASYRMRGS